MKRPNQWEQLNVSWILKFTQIKVPESERAFHKLSKPITFPSSSLSFRTLGIFSTFLNFDIISVTVIFVTVSFHTWYSPFSSIFLPYSIDFFYLFLLFFANSVWNKPSLSILTMMIADRFLWSVIFSCLVSRLHPFLPSLLCFILIEANISKMDSMMNN